MIIVTKTTYLVGPIYNVAIKDRDGVSSLASFTTWHETKDFLVSKNINNYKWVAKNG